ncbi:MAG: glycerol-3-phosphate dehydrogenase [Anaerolineaceae bacterium]|nr:glycerol-3-phosphate dehydrogenase/oxidase [Anaerolineae bacterium]MDL1925043.1 glycerol-3-phosphate dehydrogenase/oxidase [Anaerolineae bacterium AMX1]WKZ53460.1 MAG: glycerol-3-phosphate dehydrogenase/oxidase [Anaerolineales bacterium]GIK09928.1 MAG: glycerol-3-phosphate dehydrogenase [Chloroflexota bacterium]GJQ38969.1 MAG: glycerol-3-phosphate dehydrogenase [Anaerolineaceae bacterium]
MNRQETLSQIKSNPKISVLIVGAGINGIGVFRDLALNGVDALLVERGDFCSGASAASSHMAHGGIRYLENGEFRLVREAVAERNRMIQNAPHLVEPLPTTVPMFKHFSGLLNAPLKFLGLLDKPSERGSLVIKIGLMFYDAFTGKTRVVPRHAFRGRAESLKLWPRLNPDVRATATYYDGSILNPERLALEVMLDGEADGGRALNYVSLVGGQGNAVTLRDELTGAVFDVQPKLVVNAAGPWIDAANSSLGLSTRFIGGTKGSHLVLDHPELRETIGNHEFFFENKDGRIVLIFPLYDRVIVGTSDIPIENPDDALCTDAEVDYFLEMIARVFPDIKVTRENIVFRFSGVRPLAHTGSAKTTGQITRDHHIQVTEGEWTGLGYPVYSLVGGKWTSFRAFAEQAADKALAFLGRTRQKSTRELPVGGGRNYPRTAEEQKRYLDGLAAWTGFPAERVRVLFERYGTRAEAAALSIARQPDQPLKSLPDFTRREVMFLCQQEQVVHLDDLLLRRTLLAMLGRLTRAAVEEMSDAAGEALGWDEGRKKAEAARALELLASRHEVRL